jgi:hypothetical protein
MPGRYRYGATLGRLASTGDPGQADSLGEDDIPRLEEWLELDRQGKRFLAIADLGDAVFGVWDAESGRLLLRVNQRCQGMLPAPVSAPMESWFSWWRWFGPSLVCDRREALGAPFGASADGSPVRNAAFSPTKAALWCGPTTPR